MVSHPNKQLAPPRRARKAVNEKANVPDSDERQEEHAEEPPITTSATPIDSHEKVAIAVSCDLIDSPSSTAKGRGRIGAGSNSESPAGRLRFNVSLQAKLAKGTELSLGVFSSDRNRGYVEIESIHVAIHRKGESLFDGDVPVGKDSKVDPGARKIIVFSDGQRKQLRRALKSKTFASVSAVYTGPAQTEVTFAIGDQESKKKKPNA